MDRPEENLQDIRRQLDLANAQLNSLEMKKGESLHDFEYRVKRHSDKLFSLKVAEKVQWQLLEQEAREAEEQLKKKVPDLRREIVVQNSRLAERQHSLSRRQ